MDQGPSRELHLTQSQLDELVRDVADQIYDPCGMAIGLKVGLNEMGLIRNVSVESGEGGWAVRVRLRLTSPGCQYFFYFQQELERRLLGHAGVAAVTVDWDETIDWTPEDLAASARQKIERRRLLLEQARV